MPDNLTPNYYDSLGITPSASVQQVRQAYRELSKLYHPDTTELPSAIATAKFQHINEAYATLSSPERRAAYDLKLGYSRVSVIQPPPNLNRPVEDSRSYRSSAYLDPTDRPLSAGELFALFILGITFIGCLILVITISFTRSDSLFQPLPASSHASPFPVVMDTAEERSSAPVLPEPSALPPAIFLSPSAPVNPPPTTEPDAQAESVQGTEPRD